MGFMESTKAANMNFGRVDSPDFPACYITQKGDHFMITGAQAGTYEFYKEDIICFKLLSTGDNWIKWLMRFKDGKYAVITCDVTPPSQKGSGVSMAPIERFFGDLLFNDVSIKNANNENLTNTEVVTNQEKSKPIEESQNNVQTNEKYENHLIVNNEEVSSTVEQCEVTSNQDLNVKEVTNINILENLNILKKLKELLDLGAITQSEFEEKKILLLSGIGVKKEEVQSIDQSVSTASKNQKGLRIFNFILTNLTIVTFIVGVICLFSLDFRYFAGYSPEHQQVWLYSTFLRVAFSSTAVIDIAVWCLFILIGAILMLVSLAIKLIIEIKQNKDNNKIIILDIITILISAVSIVPSAIIVDWAKPGVKLFLILTSSCAIAILVHLFLGLIKKLLEYIQVSH